MKNHLEKAMIILVLLLANNTLQAQRLGNLLKDVSRDVRSGVTDALADKLADKIVEKVVESFSARLDTVLQEAYEADTTGRDESVSYIDFINNMDESEKVSQTYQFDLATKQKNIDPDGRESYSTNHYSQDGSVLGIQSEEMFIVLDSKNKIMVTYNLEEKSAFAFGESLMRFGSKLIPNDLIPSYELQNSSGNKNILGYNCEKYIGETQESSYELFVATDFPISMERAYSAIGEVFLDERWDESMNDIKGLVLESILTEENGDVTHSVVTEIDDTGFTISKSDYTFGAPE